MVGYFCIPKTLIEPSKLVCINLGNDAVIPNHNAGPVFGISNKVQMIKRTLMLTAVNIILITLTLPISLGVFDLSSPILRTNSVVKPKSDMR